VPPKLRRISGHDLVRVFENLGFYMVSQKGSHIKLRRETESGAQILIIPDHRELDRGTLFSIYRKASAYIDDSVLRPIFYSDSGINTS
jgi:predicted RNA binding protein YcfA (HicA-like mRNA interferase family)